MYRGFDLTLKYSNVSSFYSHGEKLFESYKDETEAALESFITPDGEVDGNALQDFWFPHVRKKVFISHSHDDLELAIAFGGWLHTRFGLTSFIDSRIWNHCNDLIRTIDDKYTWKKDRKVYDYNERNYSTSHVHMMLSVALTQMIDECECLFFLNTPNSIDAGEVIENATNSPWIYLEMTIAKYIEKKIPARMEEPFEKAMTRLYSLNESQKFRAKYRLDLGILTWVNWSDMIEWKNGAIQLEADSETRLDLLYKLHPHNALI